MLVAGRLQTPWQYWAMQHCWIASSKLPLLFGSLYSLCRLAGTDHANGRGTETETGQVSASVSVTPRYKEMMAGNADHTLIAHSDPVSVALG